MTDDADAMLAPPCVRLRRAIAAAELQLAELRATLAMLDGETAQHANETRPATEILVDRHITIAQLAGKLRVSEKTARSIGVSAAARTRIGGRVYYDLSAVQRYIASQNYRVLPRSSLSEHDPAPDCVGEGKT